MTEFKKYTGILLIILSLVPIAYGRLRLSEDRDASVQSQPAALTLTEGSRQFDASRFSGYFLGESIGEEQQKDLGVISIGVIAFILGLPLIMRKKEER